MDVTSIEAWDPYESEKPCAMCRVRPRMTYGAYCRPCRNERERGKRKRYSDLPPETKRNQAALAYANVYKRRGHLTQLPCERCGSTDSQLFIPDPAQPLRVRWVCADCKAAARRAAQDQGEPT